ncbi:MAG: beta-ketoacyl-ACP synthase II [Bacteroidales bacterium]|nr:beta-ketoacyl-ACP synthase II [Bacteroidales bacterium]MBS3774810.1 beta-ketoacyl-ACP synthase II [Bacteroidales bacterium]
MAFRRVVITGIGAITPIGNNLEEYCNNLFNGVSGSDWITHFDPSKFKTKFACEVKNFNPRDHFDRKELRKLDLYTQYALVSVKESMENSGIDLEAIDKNRMGVIWGSGIGGINTFLNEVKGFIEGDGTPRFSPFFIPKMISDIAAGHISIKYGLTGPNYGTVSACASASHAIIDAMNYIRLGKAEAFITGGSEAAINEAGMGGFNAMQAISVNNEEYKTASRPYDKTRDGFVMGEGGGALILEELEHAKKRGANIYAEVLGGGMSADAHHLAAPHPEGKGARHVMINALSDAALNPEKVDYINVHGTATPIGDGAEIKGIKEVFGDHSYDMNISATKSMTGHLLGAAGAVELIASVCAINKNMVPPTINHREDDPEIDNKINYTFNEAQERKVDIAISNTFGFGGHNASVVVSKFTD